MNGGGAEGPGDAATLVGGSGDAGADVPEASLAEVNFPAKAFYLFSAVGICANSSEAAARSRRAARLEGEDHRPQPGVCLSGGAGGQGVAAGQENLPRLTA